MHRSRFSVVATAAAVAAPLLLTSCVVPSPSPGTHAELNAVAAISATSAFAVGDFFDKTGQHELLERWNGHTWQEVFLPPPIGRTLLAITAVNGHNVWAVGTQRTLHFGGLGWRSIPSPAAITIYNIASAPDSAVYGLGVDSTLAGSLWLMTAGGWRLVSAVPKPTSPSGCIGLGTGSDLAVVSAHDVWVIGNGKQAGSALGGGAQNCAIALHWNGTTWQPSPMPAIAGSSLAAVSARGADDVWAVGEIVTYDPDPGVYFDTTLVLHWNGVSWAQVPTYTRGFLDAVDANANGVWDAGTAVVGSGLPIGMLIQKWNGTSMANQPVQNLTVRGTTDNESQLSGISVKDGVVTSVGSYAPRINVTATLVDRRNAG